MTNNDVLRRLRYVFDLNDTQMIEICGLAGVVVSRAEVSDWLKKDDDAAFSECSDVSMAAFLNGFIISKRGKKDDNEVVNETKLGNNSVFNKIKIALSLQSLEILELMASEEMTLSKHELSAFFRKPDHKNYRICNDQILRKFLHALQVKFRPTEPFSWD